VLQINYIPTSLTAVSIVSTYVLTAWSDATKNRFAVNPVMAVSTLTAAIIILVWDVPQAAKMFAYAISGIGYAGQASNFAWANQLCRDDEALRSITLAGMNLFSNLWYVLIASGIRN
jgi:ACS family pantothenate transporter-like MFS transporter